MNLLEIKSTKPKFWTKAGLTKLGEIIRRSRESKGITLRQAGEIISEISGMSVNYRTINSIENGVGMPHFNTLVAIAASQLVVDDKGKPLTIYDFIDIASENEPSTMNFKQLIEYELNRRGWSLRQLSDDSGIDYEDLREIFEGNDPQEYVVDILTTQLTNPHMGEKFVFPHEVIEFCNIKIAPNRVEEGLGEHTTNGAC